MSVEAEADPGGFYTEFRGLRQFWGVSATETPISTSQGLGHGGVGLSIGLTPTRGEVVNKSLILVSGQSARRYPAVGCHYFPPSLRLHS